MVDPPTDGAANLDSTAGSVSSGVDPPADGSPPVSAGATGWDAAVRLALHMQHRAGQCPCFSNFWSRHGVIVSSLLHPWQKLGAGSVREIGRASCRERV